MRIIIVFLMSLLFSCTQKSEPDATINHHIQETLPAVAEEGKKIAGETFRTLSFNLKEALSKGGVPNALKYCNIEAMPLTDSLSRKYDVQVRRASHRPRNMSNRADSLEIISIQKYLKKSEKKEELEPYTYSSEDVYIYHAPILIGGQLCLNCHGGQKTDITQADLEIIQELYPEDEATGFSIGELRGIWSIEFPKQYFEN